MRSVGMLSGLAAGLALGAMVNPPHIGLTVGAIAGAACGLMAGFAMNRDARRGAHRTRQLDDIIGVTAGSLGTPPKSIPPGDLTRDPESTRDLESWASEWLTPPPPRAIGVTGPTSGG